MTNKVGAKLVPRRRTCITDRDRRPCEVKIIYRMLLGSPLGTCVRICTHGAEGPTDVTASRQKPMVVGCFWEWLEDCRVWELGCSEMLL